MLKSFKALSKTKKILLILLGLGVLVGFGDYAGIIAIIYLIANVKILKSADLSSGKRFLLLLFNFIVMVIVIFASLFVSYIGRIIDGPDPWVYIKSFSISIIPVFIFFYSLYYYILGKRNNGNSKSEQLPDTVNGLKIAKRFSLAITAIIALPAVIFFGLIAFILVYNFIALPTLNKLPGFNEISSIESELPVWYEYVNLCMIRVNGKDDQCLNTLPEFYYISKDGTLALFQTEDKEIFSFNPANLTYEKILSPIEGKIHYISLSPDNKSLVYFIEGEDNICSIFSSDMGKTETQLVSDNVPCSKGIHWDESNTSFYFSINSDTGALKYDLFLREVIENPFEEVVHLLPPPTMTLSKEGVHISNGSVFIDDYEVLTHYGDDDGKFNRGASNLTGLNGGRYFAFQKHDILYALDADKKKFSKLKEGGRLVDFDILFVPLGRMIK